MPILVPKTYVDDDSKPREVLEEYLRFKEISEDYMTAYLEASETFALLSQRVLSLAPRDSEEPLLIYLGPYHAPTVIVIQSCSSRSMQSRITIYKAATPESLAFPKLPSPEPESPDDEDLSDA